MKKLAATSILALALASGAARGSSPKIWVTDTTADFSAGVAHGVSAEPGGLLTLSMRAEKVDGVADSNILCAAEEPSGALLLGTGGEGKIYRQERGKGSQLLASLPEKQVTALAAGSGGTVYAATSPRGKVYRIEGAKSSVFFDPGADYIWALALAKEKTLFVATGLPGKIFRVDAAGKAEEIFDAQEEHVRCLFVDSRGVLWAGTSGKGRVLRIGGGGKAETVYNSARPEISSLVSGGNGIIWAAANSAKSAPSGGAGRFQPPTPSKEKKPDSASGSEGGATVTVSVSTSLTPPPAPPPGPGGESSELIEIEPDGVASTVWNSNDELIYALRSDARGDVTLATGPRGRIYFLRKREASLWASFDEKNVVQILGDAAVTDTSAAVYRLVPARSGDYVSAVKDTGRVSRFGAFRFDADLPAGSSASFSFRSGNSALPDATWSGWSEPFAAPSPAGIPAPAGRYLQWKALLHAGSGGESPRILRVECAYENRNAAPVVESVSTLAPGAVDGSTGNASIAYDDAPEMESIFTGLDDKSSSAAPGGRPRKKGYLTVVWKASDQDNDELTYDLEFRPESSDAWVPMRKNLKSQRFAFDSTLLPDGRYFFRVTASDAAANPEDARSDSRVSDAVTVDNTPPAIEVLHIAREGREPVIKLRVADALSPLQQVEWSVNAGGWNRAAADDGMTDSPTETYTITLKPENKGSYLLIRAADAAGNVASKSIVVP